MLSAALLGVYDICKKHALHQNATLAVLWLCSASGALVLLPVLLINVFFPNTARDFHIPLPSLSLHQHLLLLIKSGIVTLSWVCTFFAIKRLPLTVSAPLRASAPLFTLLGAVLLFGERPTTVQWAGISVTLVSYWAFSLAGRLEGLVFHRDPAVLLMLVGALLGGASGLYDKYLLQGLGLRPLVVQVWFAMYLVLLQLPLVILWWFKRAKTTPLQWRWSIPMVGLLLVVADQLYFRAVFNPESLIAGVSVIRRSSVVVSFVGGILLFGEGNLQRKGVALAGVLLGLVLLLVG